MKSTENDHLGTQEPDIATQKAQALYMALQNLTVDDEDLMHFVKLIIRDLPTELQQALLIQIMLDDKPQTWREDLET